jgi:hypothetical protein
VIISLLFAAFFFNWVMPYAAAALAYTSLISSELMQLADLFKATALTDHMVFRRTCFGLQGA